MSEQSSTPAPNRFERILDRPLPRLNAETVIFCVILLLAIFSRFYLLGDRVMSHDEINHVVPAWNFYEGRGYTHDPMTHGPLQFHLMALSYSLFGDTDAASRVPDAVFSVLTVLFVMLAYRRYLGRTGALVAGALFLISPLMLFYGRYTRNEVYGAFFAVAMLYLTLRYLEEGQNRHLLWMAAVTVLSITDKATGYIFTAELMIFLAVVFMWRISRRRWVKPGLITPFVILLVAALGLVLGGVLVHSSLSAVAAAGTTTISAAEAPTVEVPAAQPNAWMAYLLVGLGLAALAGAAVCFVRGLTWRVITRERSFDLIMLLGTLILPLLASFVIRFMGWNPLDYSGVNLMRSLAVLGVLAIGAGALGMVWKPRVWLYSAGIFYAIFFILYTSLFTNSGGVLSGLLGQLGYWLEQQGVARGGQPWYVYVFVELPMYEYLAVIGTLLTAIWGLVTALRNRPTKAEEAGAVLSEAAVEEEIDAQLSEAEIDKESGLPLPEAEVAAEQTIQRPPVLGLLLYWSAISLVAFTLAGEKMGWLTVHIIVGMLLA
ncbi:MAG: glycosyltransferase family 39 protein, partial [Anaerolineaceae bacterium]